MKRAIYPMDLAKFYDSEFAEHGAVLQATMTVVRAPFERMVTVCAGALKAGGKLMFFGNGGSAADAQHLATEFAVRYVADRPAMAALALTTDSSLLTAASNDFGYDVVFARQIEALAKPGDVAIGISTSGQSGSIIAALEKARSMGVTTVGFSGRNGGKMVDCADPLIIVPSEVTARIQEMHILLGHMLCNAVEMEMGLVAEGV